MDSSLLSKTFEFLSFDHKLIVSTLALLHEPQYKTSLATFLSGVTKQLGREKVDWPTALPAALKELQLKGLLTEGSSGSFACAEGVSAIALRAALDLDTFEAICEKIGAANPAPNVSYGTIYARSYEVAIGRLQIALLRGQKPDQIQKWLDSCGAFINARHRHPFVDACGMPFDPELFKRVHTSVRRLALAFLVQDAMGDPLKAPPLRQWIAADRPVWEPPNPALAMTLAEDCLLCGRLDDTLFWLNGNALPWAQAMRGTVLLLRGDSAAAMAEFTLALKSLRKEDGQRAYFSGIYGFLYVLALLRDNEPAKTKRAESIINEAARQSISEDMPFEYMRLLIQARNGTLNTDSGLFRIEERNPLVYLFQMLTYYWLDVAKFSKAKPALINAYTTTVDAGFFFGAAQFAELLGRLGDTHFADLAVTIRTKHGFANLVDWFARQETWQRQLEALANLAPSGRAATPASSLRLAWMAEISPDGHYVTVEPREQKRSARGIWTAGRAVALKRLVEDEKSEFTEPHDRRVIATIERSIDRYGRAQYEMNTREALAALVGHPLVFWSDTPTVRLEVLSGEPQLLVQAQKSGFKFSVQPSLDSGLETVMLTKETPTRLRVTKISDEHRRIAAIVGNGLTVPAHAKQMVLDAIAAISSLVTVHSDVEGGAANVRQVEADTRLHAHLLPYEAGLKLQILVRPFADAGPYFTPGSGPESVIAEIEGQPCQARRELKAERKAEIQLTGACPTLTLLEPVHGEWLIDEPSAALELLGQLQAQGEQVVIAWPEGEKFKLRRQVDSKKFSLSIKRETNWFAATGELQITEDKVVDLRKLMELLKQSSGRFIPLGGNEFVALTDEFKRRLQDLDAFGDAHGDGVRVHPLAAFALEELVDDAGKVTVDNHWKQHRKRLREVDSLQPQVPTTLQAELRDYQVTGFDWLTRLAHWGGGACLADDMGLGKTLQALALILSRAQQGPALVIAPTSVCMNWQAEAARFAPTLNLIMFGAGDRNKALSKLKPFDLVVSSYGLLQQEAELFASVQWNTIVLDEAQAIKNKETKRAQAALALRGDFKIVATGTPLENHLGELWTLFHFTNPGLLGSHEQFNQRFAAPIERRQDATARTQLRRLIQPFILRRTKTQVLAELPSRTEIVRQVDLSAEEMALYEALRREALERLAEIEGPAGQKHIQILAEIMKLRRACCHPQLVAPKLMLPGSKLAVFGELLDELLENNHKALVFSQFVDHLAIIRAYLDERGVRYQYLDGATPMQARKTRVDAFQAGEGDVFLISLKAGGTGLNLTAADYVIHMDPWWNPAVEDQASDRAHRMGQQRPVTIYRLVARHTIEEKIVQMHQHKRDLADSLLGGGDISGKMSADAILQLLEEEFRE